MATSPADMLARWKRFDVTGEVTEIVRETALDILELQSKQLLAGEGSDGNRLPRYEDDQEFFKGNVKAIRAYERWKARITPQTPYGVMNFFQNGYTHGRLRAIIQGNVLRIDADVPWGKNIERKAPNALGLSPNSAEKYRNDTFNERFIKRLKEQTGAQ